jgi:hypothetical protein
MPSWSPSVGRWPPRPAATGRTPSRDHPDAPPAEGARHRFAGMLPLTGSTASPRSATASAGLVAGHSETPRNPACQKHRRSGGAWFPVVISWASRRDRPSQRKGSPKGGTQAARGASGARHLGHAGDDPVDLAEERGGNPRKRHALCLRLQAGCSPAAHAGDTRGSCRSLRRPGRATPFGAPD